MRLLLPGLVTAFLAASAVFCPADAYRVTDLQVLHHDGQTFIWWTTPDTTTGWIYRVYASDHPIYFIDDFWSATQVATVKDSTWCDRRLSRITGTTYGYCVDSLAGPLAANQALFVRTVDAPGQTYYFVSAQAPLNSEDRSFLIGSNTLLAPVSESPGDPRPVYQRTLPRFGFNVEVYTLWTSDTDRPGFPAMANRDGRAFDCGIVRGGSGPANPLLVRPHHRGGSFMDPVAGTSHPEEWRLTLDDPWLNYDGNSYWYGYHEAYDTESYSNVPPTTGVVRDYTLRRAIYTLLWARRNFPIDTTRVYAQGYSMGGIGSLLMAMKRPDLFAAVCSVVGKFDFGFESEPVVTCAFNPGQPLRVMLDKMWGTVESDLPTSDGMGVYQRLNDAVCAGSLEGVGMPPLIAFNGRNDTITGWAEKMSFYQAMQRNRLGGYLFWDTREHISTTCSWDPMTDFNYLYRFRTDLSYPALSHCSADFDPGPGAATWGDSVGTFNGFVEWDTVIVDQPDRWEVTLRLRELRTRWQTFAAPESVTLDLTPRRLQQFRVHPGGLYHFVCTRISDGQIVRHEINQADSLGLVTLVWLKVHRGGTHVVMTEITDTAGVPDGPGAVTRPLLALARNPVSGPVGLDVRWPGLGMARVELLDVAGRRVSSLFRGEPQGTTHLELDGGRLAGGVYFLVARQGALASTQQVTVIH